MKAVGKKQVVILSGVIVVVGAIIAGTVYLHDYPTHHFAVVQEGVLYRSGQPDPTALRRIHNKYKIRTIINLREQNQPYEEEFCRQNNIRLVLMSINPQQPTDEQMKEFLAIVRDPACQPVLVHCEAGSKRTGVMVGAYRMLVQGWSYEDALAEAKRYRFKPFSKYDNYLQALAAKPNGSPDRAIDAASQP